ncbi:MAG TPA: T9SS type A sorting domain-containing protein, partial [Prolixibacteraceae bacterium]|nr:T9SS type A sorting domain-containing protein [Prolixibacteraceae bacterium]
WFVDLVPVFDWANYSVFSSSFTYAPQAPVGSEETVRVPLGQPVVLEVSGYDPSADDLFQWYKDDVLLTGETDSVLFVESHTENDTGVYSCRINHPVVVELTLYSELITLETSEVPAVYLLSGTTVGNGDDRCYGATDLLTVAGDGSRVDCENGSSMNLIAGRSVRLLHGFHAHAGSYVHARITTTASFCDLQPESNIAVYDKSELLDLKQKSGMMQAESVSSPTVKLYPNPNKGRFTVELDGLNGASFTVYSLSGSKIQPLVQKSGSNARIEIEGMREGIYFLVIKNDQQNIVKKFIVY